MIGTARVASPRPPTAPLKALDRLALLDAPRTFVDLSSLLLAVPGSDGVELAADAYDSDEDTRAFFRVAHPAHRPAERVQQPAAPVLPQARWRTPDHSHMPPLSAFEDLLFAHGLQRADNGASVQAGWPRQAAALTDNKGLWTFDGDDDAQSPGSPDNQIDALDCARRTGHARNSSMHHTTQERTTDREACLSLTPITKERVSDPEDTLELLRSPSLPNMMELSDIVDISHSCPSQSLVQPPNRHPRRVAPSVPSAIESLVTSIPYCSPERLPRTDASVTTRVGATTEMNDSDFEAFIRKNNQRVQQERIESRRTRTALLREPVNSRARHVRSFADDPAPVNTLSQSGSRSASQHKGAAPTEENLDSRLKHASRPPIEQDPLLQHPQRRAEVRDQQEQINHQGERRPRIRAHVQYTTAQVSSQKIAAESRQSRKQIAIEPSDISSCSTNSGPEMKPTRGIQGRRARSALGPVVPNVAMTNRTRLNQASSLHKEQLRQRAVDRRNEQDLAELLSRHNSQVQSQRRIVGRFPP
jgi:hypothetical protein